MKKTSLLVLLLLAAAAFAEEPPLPPNPFQNIPGDSADFDPFDEPFEDPEFDEDMPAYNPPNTSGNTTPRFNSTPRQNPTSSSSSSNNAGRVGSRPGSRGNNPPAVKAAPAAENMIVDSFDYPDAEILDVAKAVSKLTGKNFIYNPQDIKGRISIVSNTPVTVQDAYNAFLAALNVKGFALIPSGKYLRIERVGAAKEKQTPIYSTKGAPSNEEFITRVVPLRYIDAMEVEQTFRMWMPREARLQAYQQTNTLIITDTATHINRMLELISLLDVAGYQESLAVIPIRHAVAKDISKIIEQILTDAGSRNQNSRFGGAPRPTPTFGARPAGGSGRSGGMQVSKIIADDRTNTIIVKANAVGINEVRSIIRKLDTKVSPTEGAGRIHVVRLQFADAEQVAKTLSSITQSSAPRRTNTGFGGFSPQPQTDNTQVFQGDIKISADKFTQSLVVTAAPQDFETLKRVIETLDVPRDQVFVEAIIMEIALNRENSFGTSFVSAPNGMILPSASGSLNALLGNNPLGVSGMVLGFKSGESRTLTVGTGTSAQSFQVNTINGLVDLIQGYTDSNVIATPRIIALDNQDAEIKIGEEIPEPTTSTGANGITTTGFNSKPADLYLKVKPQINKGSDFVKLDIEQKLENFNSNNVPAALQNTVQGKSSRMTKTSVVVQNEDTVVISGLMRDAVNEITNKVPILGDIPLIGWLFKNKKTRTTKTNLLVFITPRIVKQYDTLRKVLNKQLEKRENFVRDFVGSQDPLGEQVDDIKAGLPSLNKLNPLPEAKTLESKSFYTPSSPSSRDEGDNMDYDPWGDFAPPPPYVTPPDGSANPMPDIPPPPINTMENPGGYQ